MSGNDTTGFVLEDREARLERAFIEEYLLTRGCSLDSLHELPQEEVKCLMTEASTYASNKLEEMKDKAQLAQQLHGTTERI